MDARTKYQLPFKTRLMLLLIWPFKPKPFHRLSLKEIKKQRKPIPRFFLVSWVLGKPAKCDRIEERYIPVRDGSKIRIRIYYPKGKGPFPVIMNYHGGGWVVGNLQLNEYYCTQLATRVGAVVVSVDYRLAPEHKFPTAVEDSYDALRWVHNNAGKLLADPERIAVTGDSAGGNISAVMALMSRDLDGPKLSCQVLIYPATDSRLEFPSMAQHPNAPVLGARDVHKFLETYIATEADKNHPYLSPYQAESLAGLAPAVVITAGYDPLADDGRQYHERLLEEGNTSEWVHYPRDIHGFFSLPNHTESAKVAYDLVIDRFRKYFGIG